VKRARLELDEIDWVRAIRRPVVTESRQLPLRVIAADSAVPLLCFDEVAPSVRADGECVALEVPAALRERKVADDGPVGWQTVAQLCQCPTLTVVDRVSYLDVVRRTDRPSSLRGAQL
jgi:hypothetical protein